MTRNLLIGLFLIGLLVFILAQVIFILAPFVNPLFWGGLIAFSFYPVHQRIMRLCRGNENVAAGVSTAALFLTFVPLLTVIIFSLAGESVRLYHWTMAFIQDRRYEAVVDRLRSIHWLFHLKSVVSQWGFFHDAVRLATSSLGHVAAAQAAVVTKSLVIVPFHFFLMMFMIFFFLRDGEKIYRFLFAITPMEEHHKKDVFDQVTATFEAVIRGQLLTALVQAILAGIAFWILGVPLPIFFAALTFLAALVPVFGAPLVWFPFVLYFLFENMTGKAVALFLVGTFVISLVDNLLKPMLIGEKTKLPYLVLFLGILGGMQAYGLIGIFVAPVVLSLFFALIRIYREQYLNV